MSRAQTFLNIVGAVSSFCVLRRQYSEWNVVACPIPFSSSAHAIHSVVFLAGCRRRILFKERGSKGQGTFSVVDSFECFDR